MKREIRVIIGLAVILIALVIWWIKGMDEMKGSIVVVRLLTCSGVAAKGELTRVSDTFTLNTGTIWLVMEFLVGDNRSDVKVDSLWYDPDSQEIAKFSKSYDLATTRKKSNVEGQEWVAERFQCAIAQDRLLSGQKKLPQIEGMYIIQTYVDGRHVGSTPFMLRR